MPSRCGESVTGTALPTSEDLKILRNISPRSIAESDGSAGVVEICAAPAIGSRNVASARILQSIGIAYARDYVTRFGFSADQVAPYLTMVLGVGSVTPLQMAQAYSMFANTGYRVAPYFIERIVDRDGGAPQQTKPARTGEDAGRVIDARSAFIMTSIMQDVIRCGTAAWAMQLGRHDLAGKTGTTNDFTDAWRDGFNEQLVAVAWIGFDQPRSAGKGRSRCTGRPTYLDELHGDGTQRKTRDPVVDP
jgi:membrane carboxypeptidase/penicillin-binding protein